LWLSRFIVFSAFDALRHFIVFIQLFTFGPKLMLLAKEWDGKRAAVGHCLSLCPPFFVSRFFMFALLTFNWLIVLIVKTLLSYSRYLALSTTWRLCKLCGLSTF